MGRTKKQTRLAFNPLPTSSPASSTAVKELGSRSYANVGYEGSPASKRRRIMDDDADLGLPTPAKSSQFPKSSRQSRLSDIQLDGASDTPPASSSSRRQKRGAQGRLDFSNHIGMRLEESEKENSGSGDSTSDTDEEIMRTKTPPRKAKGGPGMFPTQNKRRAEIEDDSDDELMSDAHTTPKGKTPLSRLRRGRKEKSEPRRLRRRTKQQDADSEEEDGVRASARVRRRRSSVPITIEISDGQSETSGDDAPELFSTPAKSKKTRAKATKSYKEDDFVVDEDEDEDTFVVEDEPERVARKSSHKSRRRRRSPTPDEGSEEEEDEPQPKRRRLKRRKHEVDEQDKEDLEEDLEWLQSSPPGAKINHAPKKPNPKLEALAALKRRRAGLEAPDSSAPLISSRQPVTIDSSDEQEDAQEGSEEEYEVAAEARRRGALDSDDGEEEDFIDDEDAPLGVPDDLDLELPAYLNGIHRMKGKALFHYAVEWMVQRKLNPAFSHNKETYDIALQRLDDEVRGLAGSKFTSSAWTREFTVSLQARPDVELSEISGFREVLEDKCQACNRSGHPATFMIQFGGRPYDPRTLEPVVQDWDDETTDEEDEEEREEKDYKHRIVPSASRVYSVGRFCKDNAMTAHALEHWKYQLSGWIVEWLEEQGHLTNEKIVRRDRWDEPRRRKYAKKVVNEMEECGQVAELYRQFRAEIDSAREQKSGWQREKEREW